MLQRGILNPAVLSLIARIRHTNTLVIADWAFPFWPQIETVDISLTHGIPTVLQVLDLLKPDFKIGHNPVETVDAFQKSFMEIPEVLIKRPAHLDFKKLVPNAIGLIRTGDATPYGNIIVESV
jgi:D-ribose pyranase